MNDEGQKPMNWRKAGLGFFQGMITLTCTQFHHRGELDDTGSYDKTAFYVICRELDAYMDWLLEVFPKHRVAIYTISKVLREVRQPLIEEGNFADPRINSGKTEESGT